MTFVHLGHRFLAIHLTSIHKPTTLQLAEILLITAYHPSLTTEGV